MKVIALAYIVLGILSLFILYYAARFGYSVYVSLGLVNRAAPYEKASEDSSFAMLVLGDSTAVGVGADRPEDSLAGRVSGYLHATSVENYSKSGAVASDLPQQIEQAKLQQYRLILIQIGANDIIDFKSASTTAERLAPILDTLPKADQTILLTSGNVGGATIFPPILRPFYTRLNLAYHAAFADIATARGITYVNLYEPKATDPFAQHPGIYLAPDGLHPSSSGYGLWFDRVRAVLRP